MSVIHRYFVEIKSGRILLWCYLIWYAVSVYYHFDPSFKLWLNSVGISLVIGTALMLSVSREGRADYWQIFRLYWMPFAVSSFAALIKSKGYIVIFSPDNSEILVAIGCCCVFVVLVLVLKWGARKSNTPANTEPA